MKILLLTTFPLNKKKLELSNCMELYHIYTYFIYYELKHRNNIQVLLQKVPRAKECQNNPKLEKLLKFPEVDHCFLIDNRGFFYRPEWFFEILRPMVKKCIATISDNIRFVGPEDVLFFQVPARKKPPHSHYIGWATSPRLCKPAQKKDQIRILIDHLYYGTKSKDMINSDKTMDISKKAFEFAKNSKKMIEIRRLCIGGAETLTEQNYKVKTKYVQNGGMSYEKACEEYSQSDVYFVTHKESMGLTVLECAMAGALIVSPKGYIKQGLLSPLHHIEYDDKIPWVKIIKNINHKKARDAASKYNWKMLCDRMLRYFNKFKIN